MVDLASPFLRLQKGTSVLLNVLNRADTNGDGVLAKEEFLNFFWDAILTEDELCEVFDSINIHKTGFIDAAELSSFVWQHLGGLSGLLASLEDMSAETTKGLHYVEKSYDQSSLQNQFVIRFLIREAAFQLSKQLNVLEAAQRKFQENGIPLIDGSDDDDDVELPVSQPQKCLSVYKACQSLRHPVRVRKQVVTQTSIDLEGSSQELNTQIKKLETIVEKLANQPRLKRPQQQELDITEENLQTLPVDEQQLECYKSSLEHYTTKTASCLGCLLITVRLYKDISTYAVYEIWESEDMWNAHLRSPTYKALQHQNIETLRKPEFLNTMEIPGSWWEVETDP
ncbi:N-terminal EF-hand calcium-binding protein 1-like isoform X2 [Ornithodoros turicata]|uniref:N-terminal EF-hand calcium-binding protein 1-like isoform X2 n=1 Tax=Ornithodoros turicata TaxID=34597 RepID=UPI003139A2E1